MDCIGRLDRTDELKCWILASIGGEERFYEARLVGAEGDKVLKHCQDMTDAHGQPMLASR